MFFSARLSSLPHLEKILWSSYRPSPSCANPGLTCRGPYMLRRGPSHFMLLAIGTFKLEVNPSFKPLTIAHRNRDLFNHFDPYVAPGKNASLPMVEGFIFLLFWRRSIHNDHTQRLRLIFVHFRILNRSNTLIQGQSVSWSPSYKKGNSGSHSWFTPPICVSWNQEKRNHGKPDHYVLDPSCNRN